MLHDASYSGDASKVTFALQAGAEVDSTAGNDTTALMLASAEGHEESMRLLLEAGAAVDAATTTAETALMLASGHDREGAVRVLLKAGAALDSTNSIGWTALMCAVDNGYEGVVRVLLSAGAAVNAQTHNGGTALTFASESGHEGAIQMLLEAGAMVNLADFFGGSALAQACGKGHAGVIRVLLEAGAAVDGADQRGITALMSASACSPGHVVSVRLLVEAGAALELKNNTGMTALLAASSSGLEGVMRELVEAGAAVDAKDNTGSTSLMHVSGAGNVGAMRVLLEAGAAVDLTDDSGNTALVHTNGQEDAMRRLLASGAAAGSHDNHGVTALMVASMQGNMSVVRLLLGADAAVDALDRTGETARARAVRDGNLDMARLLLEAGGAVPEIHRRPDSVKMQQLLALHRRLASFRGGRRAPMADQGLVGIATAEAAAAAAADALLAEEEAEKSSVELRQATTKRKKKRQKAKRAESVPGLAPAGSARSGPAPSGETPPIQASSSQAATAGGGGEGGVEGGVDGGAEGAVSGGGGYGGGGGDGAVGGEVEEGQEAEVEAGPEGALCTDEGGVLARASQASDGADERGGAEEEIAAAVTATLEPPRVVTVPAEEVLRALEAAGSDGEVGEGGFGKVFAAELPSLAVRWGCVAVKCASGLQAADILLEVGTLRLCCHHNVLLLLGYCDDARAPCMITPLMHGGSLDDRLLLSDAALERLRRLGFEGDARLDWQRRLSALCDAARGLAHLHGERILHRDVKTANILLEGALRLIQMAHGPPLLVHRAVLSDVGLAKVREPTLGGTTTHATTRNLAFSTGFGDPALLNSNQHSERTDAFGVGICILMSLVSEPAAGLMNDHEEDVCDAMEDGTGALFETAHAVAGWPSDVTRALASMVHGLSLARVRKRQPLAEALAQMEALLGAVGEAAGGEAVQPVHSVVGAASAAPVLSRGASMPPVREDEPGARAVASAQPEVWSGGELTRMVRKLELGDADASLARKRERVTKAYDSMMVRLERAYAGQGHAPLPTDEQELRKIDLLAPRHLGRLNGLAHTLRKLWNAAKHQRDQWAHPPSDKEVRRLVREVIKELDGLGW